MKRIKAKMKRIMKPCNPLILNNETLETLETLHRAHTHVQAHTATKPTTHTPSHMYVKRFKRFMRFIPMKTMILKRFIKRFIFKSSVSFAGAPA